MIVTGILIAFALVTAGLLIRAIRRRRGPVPHLSALDAYTRPVDLPAFRNLIDPAEEHYLRQRLPAGQFRALQRERAHAALDYVRRTAYNGALLLRVGEAASHDQDPEVAAAARALMNDALRLRMKAMLAMVVLYGRMAMPGARISVGRVTDIYENLTQGLVRLTRLQAPAHAARVSAAV